MQRRRTAALRRVLVAVYLLAVVSAPGRALAQIPVTVEVDPRQGMPSDPEPRVGGPEGAASLPDTGAELLILVATGAALVGAGSALRQATRTKEGEER